MLGGVYTIYHVFILFNAAMSALVCSFILFQQPSSSLHRFAFLYGAAISLWQLITFLFLSAETVEAALFWYNFYSWDPLLPIFWLLYWLKVDQHPWLKSGWFYFAVLTPTILLIIGLFLTPQARSIVPTAAGWSWDPANTTFWIDQLRYIHMYLFVIFAATMSIRIYLRHRNEEVRLIMRYLAGALVLALAVSLLGAILNDVIFFANVAVGTISYIMVYAISRGKLVIADTSAETQKYIDQYPLPTLILDTSGAIVAVSKSFNFFLKNSHLLVGTAITDILQPAAALSRIQNKQYKAHLVFGSELVNSATEKPVYAQSRVIYDQFHQPAGAIVTLYDRSADVALENKIENQTKALQDMNFYMESVIT